jgi:hypothetical protein
MIVPHFILGCGVVTILFVFVLSFICRAYRHAWHRMSVMPFKRTDYYQELKLAHIPSKFKIQQAHRPFSLRINF